MKQGHGKSEKFNWPKFWEGFGNGAAEAADDVIEKGVKIIEVTKGAPGKLVEGAQKLLQ